MTADHYLKDEVKRTTSVWELLRRLWPMFMNHKLLFFSTLVAVTTVAIASRLSVTVFGYAIDHGLLTKNREAIVHAAMLYLILEATRCGMQYLHAFLFAKLGNRLLYEIRDRLIRHVQSLPISYFEKNPTGRIVTRLTSDVISMGELFTEGLISFFGAFVSLTAIIVAMMAISVKMTFATLLIAPPLVFIVGRLSKRILEVLRESKAKLAAINAFVAESLGGMRVLQLYGRIARNSSRFQGLAGDYRHQSMKSVRLYALLWPTVSFFNAVSVGTALFVGGRLAFGGEVSVGEMIAFILHVRAFMDPLHSMLEKYQILQNSLSGAERVFTLLAEEPESLAGAPCAEGRLRGEVQFDHVSFRYRPTLPKALDGIDLRVEPGQSIALVGRTGSGKSTLISLLQRFHEPSEGVIRIDGRASSDISRHDLRARVGVVQQDTFMFRGPIAQNISLGDPRISRERVERAAEMACLGEILERHAGGLDGKVEERGANLSVGERQLIAFARILAFDPDVLILDEATANIDSRTENLLQEAAKRVREGRTSFIIAHRISTVLDCDRIVVLDGGKIVEMGSHDELMAKSRVYFALVQAQFKDETATTIVSDIGDDTGKGAALP